MSSRLLAGRSPRARADFDGIAARYDETRGGEPRGMRFGTALAPFLGAGPTLEIGVGTGVVGLSIEQKGHPVFGLDVSIEMLRRARPRLARLVRGDGSCLPFANGSFGDAYAIWVMHMAPDLTSALREIRRVLRPGGRFLTSSVANGQSDDAIGRLMWSMQAALLRERLASDAPDRLADLAPVTGFEFESRVPVEQIFSSTPNDVAATVERRGYSNLREVSDDDWRRYVEPTIEALRRLPDPQQLVERKVVHEISVLRARDDWRPPRGAGAPA